MGFHFFLLGKKHSFLNFVKKEHGKIEIIALS